MGRYDAILFDFDGVLADSEPLHFECWRDVLTEFGIVLTWDNYERCCIGVADREMIEALVGLAPEPVEFERVWARYPAKKELFRERVRDCPMISAATCEFLGRLAGYSLAVVSSSARPEIEPLLEQAGVRALFGTVVCGEDVERLKPAPDPYLLAAQRLGVSRPLVVEDSAAGEASGRAAGFDVVRVSSAGSMAKEVRAVL